jgi:hypothetical protein
MPINEAKRRARAAPRANPGKKPATTAIAGNLLHCAVRGRGAVVLEEGVEAGFGVVVAVEDGAEDVRPSGGIVWSAFFTQFPVVLQVKPNGQQLDPQVGRATLSTIVFKVLSGCAVVFCC